VVDLTFESTRRSTVERVTSLRKLAQRSGVPATTLRFYADAGLLPAERTASGYRIYGQQVVERLEFIAAAKHLGLPLAEISELLAVWESGACADLRPRLAARIVYAGRRIAAGAPRRSARPAWPNCCLFFDVRLQLDGAAVHLKVRTPAEGVELFARAF
jgi:DNA-binding transcriptional MerR regulator